MRKRVVFVADSLDNAYLFQRVLSMLDVEVAAGSTLQVDKLLHAGQTCSLIVFEARGAAFDRMGEIVSVAERNQCPLLVIVEESDLKDMQMPTLVACDFVVHGATQAECLKRVRVLMKETGTSVRANIVTVDAMSLNLDTYQVKIAGEPVDFTYLEYALLSFLVQHPDRAFSRDALLQRVWGFDYYGGSRTVDVHVRRIRAKIGPGLAQYLETVRGVGYLWRSALQ